MAAHVRDILKTNIVLVGLGLLGNTAEVNAFGQAVGTDEIVAEAGILVGIPGAPQPAAGKLSLQRDRISVQMLPDRTVIEREFPERRDLTRLAEVYGKAIESTKSQRGMLRAYGYNLDLVYDQDSGSSSRRYLGDRLFGNGNFAPEGWTLGGGAAKLFFDSPAGAWTIQVEPRANDDDSTRVFMSLNLHRANLDVPNRTTALQSLEEVWDSALSLIERLDEGVM